MLILGDKKMHVCEICFRRNEDKALIEQCESVCRVRQAILQQNELVITENHLKLLKQQNIKFEQRIEFGATCIDPKRPYGNSDVYGDIAEIIGAMPTDDDCDIDEHEELALPLYRIHVEMTLVWQIIAQTQQVSTGRYRRKDNWKDWEQIKPKEE